jgi:UDP-N-acetylmuramate: L-alanyl-gamma-D-glutamyl-meso-diaminopimelate ligase
MGGLALLAREAGHKVTGCDAGVYPPMSEQLQAQGIELIEGFSPDQLGVKPDIFVVGNVISRGNPLMEAILEAGLPYTSGPQWLSDHILQGRHVMAVAGTHGKTTTTSMLAWILEDHFQNKGSKQIGFLVGGVPLNFGVSARLGDADMPFVIEADEYDTAFFDKRSKFVHYRPRTVILNNLEFDHADIFANLDAIEIQFHHMIRTVPQSGLIVVNARDKSLERVLSYGCWSRTQYFGHQREQSDGLRARGEHHAFDVLRGGIKVGQVQWSLSGEHNQLNALAAIAAAEHLGIRPERSSESLNRFINVRRRLELKGQTLLPTHPESEPVSVYDDFAHHPSAIRTTIHGLRKQLDRQTKGPAHYKRILAVFEPRSNTMKLGTMKNQLPWALEEADLAFCHSGGLSWDASSVLARMEDKAMVCPDIATLVELITNHAQPGDAILCMSNGSFSGIHSRLLNALQQHESKLV